MGQRGTSDGLLITRRVPPSRRGRRWRMLRSLLLATIIAASNAFAQDSVTVVADSTIGKGGLRRLILGDHYRDLWLAPVKVAKLDLAREGGGLTPTRKGGGLQTVSLRFKGGDGKQYVFRVMKKDASRVLPPELRETFAAEILHDQQSAMHPAAALVVPPILEAAGILHVTPRLLVMPDDPKLGEFRAEFANQLGTLEERPTDGDDDSPGFAGAKELLDMPELIEALRDKPWIRVDTRAFVTARLLDLYFGDWDRHEDQWRWALVGDGKEEHYLPIPRDRDQAFVRYDGVALSLMRIAQPQLIDFGTHYATPEAATFNGRFIDRRLLVEATREDWAEAARAIQAALTDAVIDEAINRMPPEYKAIDGARLRDALIQRRDGLPRAADRTYEYLARQVRLEAGDKDDLAVINRQDNGDTEVTLSRKNGERYYHRLFKADDTEDIYLELRGGDDRVTITGEGKGPLLRVVGWTGSDTLIDESKRKNSRFYDEDDNTVATGRKVDNRPFVMASDTNAKALPERDWGGRVQAAPYVYASTDLGFLLGYNWAHRGYGFRRQPYASLIGLRAAWSFGRTSGRLEMDSKFRLTNRPMFITADAMASGIETLHFYGFGNNTPEIAPKSFYRVHRQELSGGLGLGWGLTNRAKFRIGARVQHSVTDLDDESQSPDAPLVEEAPLGVNDFGAAGVVSSFEWDDLDYPMLPTRGGRVRMDASVYPVTWSTGTGAYGSAGVQAAWFLSPGKQNSFTLVARGAGRVAFGDYPYFEAAYLGGARSLRGFPANRFAGDASLLGSAEARLRLFNTYILVPGQLGVFGVADYGRVFLEDDTSGDDVDAWHSDFGGGLYYGVLKRTFVFAAGWATGKEGSRFYFGLGLGQ